VFQYNWNNRFFLDASPTYNQRYLPDAGCKLLSSGVIKTHNALVPLWSDVEIDISPKDGEVESGKKQSTRRIKLHEHIEAVLIFKKKERGFVLNYFNFSINKNICKMDVIVAYANEEKLREEAAAEERMNHGTRRLMESQFVSMTRLLKYRKIYDDLSRDMVIIDTWHSQISELTNVDDIPSNVLHALDRLNKEQCMLAKQLAEQYF
jgi:hypothetical protein